ncbi:MAG TPA: helix-turn-helix transcriptional regulator [Noviherbaspirillum sp.]|jgi:DNA-binding CsgD family transcriptional regulator|uniref:helix-turn-helix transcriptional regulator n=1 Tax=Noviherbaspirillum sp. TaxID=1926288 RepID=UPI002F94A2F0
MNAWTLAQERPAPELALDALSQIIAHIGTPLFPSRALTTINRALPAGSWSVYRTAAATRPVCYLSDSYQRADTTGLCFRAYRDGLYREDRTFDALGADELGILHLTAGEVRHPEHRRLIYEHHRLRERLSAARRDRDGGILTVNLYRHDDQPGFRDRDLRLFEAMAGGLFATVERQIALCPGAADQAMQRDAALRRIAPGMPPREVEVCLRLLRGMSHDGIACDLGISATTVKTYRNRAYARLGIHRTNELFALVTGGQGLRVQS